MAKARAGKSTKNTHAGTNDAQRLAAIRWLAMKIEQVSIELLVTDRDKFEAVEASLRDEVIRLKRMAAPELSVGDDCPEGYVLCRDGLCAPMCDGANSSSAAASRAQGKKR
jgi:hypothetical protein